MMWTVYPGDTTCGKCRVTISTGDPVALFAHGRLKRCAHCAGAMGFEVDFAEVDQARFEIERRAWAERAETDSVPLPVVYRTPAVREPVPLSMLASSLFDPKAAAAGDRDE